MTFNNIINCIFSLLHSACCDAFSYFVRLSVVLSLKCRKRYGTPRLSTLIFTINFRTPHVHMRLIILVSKKKKKKMHFDSVGQIVQLFEMFKCAIV